jgi:hypothetical protein
LLIQEPSEATMDDADIIIMNLGDARRTLTGGDLRSDVAFQNDVNRLLATLDELCDAASDTRARSA